MIVLAGPTVLSAVGVDPPHDGVRRRWLFNVAIAVVPSDARKKSVELTIAIVPAGTSFPAVWLELINPFARQQELASTPSAFAAGTRGATVFHVGVSRWKEQ
jgi:hypothetical protein